MPSTQTINSATMKPLGRKINVIKVTWVCRMLTLSFLHSCENGMDIIKIDGSLETRVYRKKTNKGLLPHYQSHVVSRYKRSLLRTMLDRAKRLSCTQEFLSQECKNYFKISREAHRLSYQSPPASYRPSSNTI